MTNWGAHHIDIAHWGMGMDNSGPLEVHGVAKFHPMNWHEVTEECRITYKYPNDVEMIVGQKQSDIPIGTTFIGSDGTIHVNRGKLSSKPDPVLIKTKLTADDVALYRSSNHHQNFLDCIKTRELPICDVERGHRSATACHLGNISCRLNRAIKWDATDEAIVGDSEAQEMTHYDYREPWILK